jgi:hypothetical protein
MRDAMNTEFDDDSRRHMHRNPPVGGFGPGSGHHGGPGWEGEQHGHGRRRGMRAPRGDELVVSSSCQAHITGVSARLTMLAI